MSKRRPFRKILPLAAIAVIVIPGFLLVPKFREFRIKQAIIKANYCEIDSDCVDAGSKCPFGCYAYVNKKEAARIGEMIAGFDSSCIYGCLACPEAVCRDNKCKEVCEQ